GGDLVLFAAGLDDCEHRFFPVFRPARHASICAGRLLCSGTEIAAYDQTAGLTLGFEALNASHAVKTKSAALRPRWSEARPIGGQGSKVNRSCEPAVTQFEYRLPTRGLNRSRG